MAMSLKRYCVFRPRRGSASCSTHRRISAIKISTIGFMAASYITINPKDQVSYLVVFIHLFFKMRIAGVLMNGFMYQVLSGQQAGSWTNHHIQKKESRSLSCGRPSCSRSEREYVRLLSLYTSLGILTASSIACLVAAV